MAILLSDPRGVAVLDRVRRAGEDGGGISVIPWRHHVLTDLAGGPAIATLRVVLPVAWHDRATSRRRAAVAA